MNQQRLDQIRRRAKEIPEHSASFEDLIEVLVYVEELEETWINVNGRLPIVAPFSHTKLLAITVENANHPMPLEGCPHQKRWTGFGHLVSTTVGDKVWVDVNEKLIEFHPKIVTHWQELPEPAEE